MLVVKDVVKKFKNDVVIKNANMTCKMGTITGIVGDNGSGKTVLMKLIVGLMRATEGFITYNSKALKKDFDYLPSVGLIIEHPSFFDELTGFENLKLLANINNKISDDEIRTWIKRVGLVDDNKKVENYSLGMRQRLGIAQALMENPDVIILDECTNTLDENGIHMVHTLLKEEKSKGKIIIISSHSRYDILELCDEIYTIKEGVLNHAASKNMDLYSSHSSS